MKMISIKSDFWNIRGSFKLGGVVDLGTQSSLVKCANGDYVFLDACAISSALHEEILQMTEGGKRVKAIINLHPFHTLYVSAMHEMFPSAALYGTARHVRKLPDLPWERLCTNDAAFHKKFDADFEFSVPKGVDFIAKNENVHFSSVLVFHKKSKTIHVDDTFMFSHLPKVLIPLGIKNTFGFHPTLALALQKRPGAADEFERWAKALIEQWHNAENLCAAHTAPLLLDENSGESIATRMTQALNKVKWLLRMHRLRYGR